MKDVRHRQLNMACLLLYEKPKAQIKSKIKGRCLKKQKREMDTVELRRDLGMGKWEVKGISRSRSINQFDECIHSMCPKHILIIRYVNRRDS